MVLLTVFSGILKAQVPWEVPADHLVKAESEMAIGLQTLRPPLNEPRALWNVVQKTPVWLLMTYLIVVLGVLGAIFFVMLQLRTIFKLGE